MDITRTETDRGLTLRLDGRLDAHRIADLDAALEPLPAGDLTLDLAGVSFVDSTALARLVTLQRTLAARGDRLRLRQLQDPVRLILEVTRLDSVLLGSDPPTGGVADGDA